MSLEIKAGAFVVTDAHYSPFRPHFLAFLDAIDKGRLAPTQLIFLGDIFDTLFGGVDVTLKQNSEAIALLQRISQKIEFIYLEGNHDFHLDKLFVHAKVFSIEKQPVRAYFGTKKVLLAHGDVNGPLGYRVYTKIIRNPFVLAFLNSINNISNYAITRKLAAYLEKKVDCKEFVGFEAWSQKRVASWTACDIYIDGHFHQNQSFTFGNLHYINCGAFACNQRFFIVQSTHSAELLHEMKFEQEVLKYD